jgi:CDP-paratose 2-epimerase
VASSSSHCDARDAEDVLAVGAVDAVVECSAEPSVLAGVETGLDRLVKTNLLGAYTCFELCQRHDAQFVFLSTSRVCPVAPLEALAYVETETRFESRDDQALPGVTSRGISEAFPLDGARTFYGTTKLAAELLVADVETFGLQAVVDRCA